MVSRYPFLLHDDDSCRAQYESRLSSASMPLECKLYCVAGRYTELQQNLRTLSVFSRSKLRTS